MCFPGYTEPQCIIDRARAHSSTRKSKNVDDDFQDVSAVLILIYSELFRVIYTEPVEWQDTGNMEQSCL